jgi:hypothetical protein
VSQSCVRTCSVGGRRQQRQQGDGLGQVGGDHDATQVSAVDEVAGNGAEEHGRRELGDEQQRRRHTRAVVVST